MKRVCIVVPYDYPVPACKGGAIEFLDQILIEENENRISMKPIEKKSKGLENVKKECPTAISNSSRAPHASDINSTSL